jgi:membrane protease YdiL (CAAX protease family)
VVSGVGASARPSSLSVTREWSVRYALVAYVASWLAVLCITLGAWLLGVRHWGVVGALWFDVAWVVSLVPLYRAGVLKAADLGLRGAPAARSVGLALLVSVSLGVFDEVWRSVLASGSGTNPFSGVAHKSTVFIVLTGIAAVVSPVVEGVFFQGLLFRCFRNRFALLPASAMIGVMFALVHTEYALAVLPELAVYGALACVLYEYTGSLFPAIAINLYLDAGGFEQALTGTAAIVFWSFVLLVVVLLARSLRWRLKARTGSL